jgi:formate hydrogenlyase subunit 3/multisubunit Na+/H+ antiporter MnhD subunit
MQLILLSLIVLMAGAIGSLSTRRHPRLTTWLGAGGAVAGAFIGFAGALTALVDSHAPARIRLPWPVPYGSFYLEADALSAFFLLPIFLLTGLAAVYGAQYMWGQRLERQLGGPWALYDILGASMVVVVLARNAVLFLVAWEVMALSSFFLVTMENERESVRRAGWTYLVATHLGTTALFFLFILMGREAGSLDFDRFAAAGAALHHQAPLFFWLALIGFGAKAGIVPFHVWLPEAHPAAPSHVSALMSGVMIKTGIYGLIRTLMWLGPPPVTWAWTLIAIGLVSGILGVLMALAQHDLKRLLAYHSVENIGIIVLGLGIGVLGQATGLPVLAVLGYGGALLHTVNHAVFKGLLFLAAGSVLHGARTLDLEHLGGLMRRMPWTGAAFLAGAVAICGLPPLNGFISEFLIYAGAFQGVMVLSPQGAVPALAVIGSLALIGGLAAACFTKAFGIAFLGEPKSPPAAQAKEAGPAMRWPMMVLAALCLVIGLSGPFAVSAMKPVLACITLYPPATLAPALDPIRMPLGLVVASGFLLATLIAALALLRFFVLSGRIGEETVTWDCGYAHPTVRMQYTASSFAQPLTDFSAALLRPRKRFRMAQGYFPSEAAFSTQTPDICTDGIWKPAFAGTEWLLSRLRGLQTGSVHLYILYIALTLVGLLVWKLG